MRPMFIVLDGPDAAGKTTLANHIAMKCGCLNPDGGKAKYIHMTYIKDDREMFLANYMALIQAQKWLSMGYAVVLDRGWMSENVYAGIYRGGSGLAYDVRGLDRVIQRLCGIYVIAAPTVASAVKRHAESHGVREEMYAPSNQIAQVAQRYRDLMFGVTELGERLDLDDYVQTIIDADGMALRPDAFHYDVDQQGHDLDSVFSMLQMMSERQREAQLPIGLDIASKNYVGHIGGADVLFVGDKINPNKNGKWPFVDYGASSRVISKALHHLRFNETRGVWTNANDDVDHIVDIVSAKPQITVVALGANAAKKCESLGVPHKSVYHPGFVGRFGRMQEFLQQLSNVL